MIELEELRTHISGCATCKAAYNPALDSFRVNDLCDVGTALFGAYASTRPPTSIEALSPAEAEKLIAEAKEKIRKRKAGLN